MIDVIKIRSLEVPNDIISFMQTHGGNHVSLYSGWKKYPEMGKTPDLLEYQLALALRDENYELIKRIIGRLRKVNAEYENLAIRHMIRPPTEEVVELGCLG